MRQSGFARKVKLQVFLAAALLLAPAVLLAVVVPGGGRQVLRGGHVPKITRRLSPIGRLNANDHMDVTIGLPLRHPEQLTNLLEDIYNPSSPNFRHFLKPDEFAASFAPSAEDYQSVIDFAKANHLKVVLTQPNRTLVHVRGSVADIENAFHVHIQIFKHPKENRNFFAPDAEPSLDLKTPVLAISGLDNYVKPRPHIHLANASPKIRPLAGPGGGGGSGGAGPYQGYAFRSAYLPNLKDDQDGAGQSIGLFELFGFSQQDIMDYEDESGIAYVNVQPVEIDGGTADDSNADWIDYPGFLDYAVEVTGDIETALAMAPGVDSILVYIGPTPMDVPPIGSGFTQDATTTAQINDVLNRMATDDLAKQLSCSYGFDINLSTVQIFQQMAAQGQSFFLASGDFGAFSSAVDEPADDPYITTVGGTTLVTNATTGQWSSEVVWTSPPGTDAFTGASTPPLASGGGVSAVYPIPWWQQGISMTANQGSTTMRNVPDVSMVASNIIVTWGNDFFLQSVDLPEAGTSLAAPLWAGFMAIVNQQAENNGQPPIGFANPALYAIAKSTNYSSCFHDITVGANTNSASPTKYRATGGYDLCTGWGTISTNLMQALLAPPVETLLVTSPLGFTSQGISGGPFTVTSQTYTVQNMGSAPLTWSLVNTSSWLNASSGGGTLNPGDSTTVTVGLNANANHFLITHASGNVAFNNITAGTTQNRQFDLYVGNGSFETGGLDDWTLVGDPDLSGVLAADDADIAGQQAFPAEPDGAFVHSGLYGAYLGQWPDDGSLSQTVPTTAGQKLLVSFWVVSFPDENNDSPTNNFAVSWNGSTLFMQTNLLTQSTWTNMQYIVSPTGSSGTLQFKFNNTPGVFGLDDVTVETLPAPVLSPVVTSPGQLALSWNAFSNVSYQIQSTTNLTGGGWTDVGNPILATNNFVSVFLPMDGAPGKFYRVVMSP